MNLTWRTCLALLTTLAVAGAFVSAGCGKKDQPSTSKSSTKVILKSWDFRDGVPTDWPMDDQLVVKIWDAGGVVVQTVPNKATYQLYSGVPIVLVPGNYEVVVDGQVQFGEVFLGAENIKTGKFINVLPFKPAPEDGLNTRIALPVHLDAETEVGIRFAAAESPNSNTLAIRRVDIVELRNP